MAKVSSWERKTKNAAKNVLSSLIRNISFIAIFIVLIIVTVAALGATFDLAGALAVGLGVASVLLLIGSIILYELWLRNGQEEGKQEEEFIKARDHFLEQSKNIHNQTLQDFIEWEKARRYNVEKYKLDKAIENIDEHIAKCSDETQGKRKRKLLAKRQILIDHVIEVDMPYILAEEFDELKYSVNDTKVKEYKPNDAKVTLIGKRLKKYAASTVFSLFSVNLIFLASITFTWQVLFVVLMAIVSIIIAIVTGFSTGYNLIMKNSLGIYNTANDFIDKAKTWCDIKQISLYYKEKEKKSLSFLLLL